jgi:hypothetical protein
VEPYAILGAFIVFTPIISGLIALLLSLRIFVVPINSCSKNVALLLTIFRRIVQGFFLAVGLLLGSFLLFIDVVPLKFLGLFSLALLYLALHLEYFSKNSNLRNKQMSFGSKGEPRIYSADGTEIIRAKQVMRFGRSSGRDGHGPGGQH